MAPVSDLGVVFWAEGCPDSSGGGAIKINSYTKCNNKLSFMLLFDLGGPELSGCSTVASGAGAGAASFLTVTVIADCFSPCAASGTGGAGTVGGTTDFRGAATGDAGPGAD